MNSPFSLLGEIISSPGDIQSVDLEERRGNSLGNELHSSLLLCIVGFTGRTCCVGFVFIKRLLLATVTLMGVTALSTRCDLLLKIKFAFMIQDSKLSLRAKFRRLKIP